MNNITSNEVQKGVGVNAQQSSSIQEKSEQKLPKQTESNNEIKYDDRKPPAKETGDGTENIASVVPPIKHASISASRSSVDCSIISPTKLTSGPSSKSSVGTFSVPASDNSAHSVARPKELGSVARRNIGPRPILIPTPPATTSSKQDASNEFSAKFPPTQRMRRKGGGPKDTASVLSPTTSAISPSSKSSAGAPSLSGSKDSAKAVAQLKDSGFARSRRISRAPPRTPVGATSVSGSEDTVQEQVQNASISGRIQRLHYSGSRFNHGVATF
jgi:hypothetical protein